MVPVFCEPKVSAKVPPVAVPLSWVIVCTSSTGGVARNAILRQTRRYLKIEAVEVDEEVPVSRISPSKVMRREERLSRFQEALKSLSPDHRQVITLARIEGVPVNEIANRMNRSPKAVYQLLWRALQKLRESFGDTESLHLPDRNMNGGSFQHDK